MAWLSPPDLVAQFGEREIIELTDRDEPRTGEIDAVVAARAIAEAEDIVSGLLRRRYPAWPTPTIPSGVKVRVADIARRRLYTGSVPDVVQANYEDALDWLKIAAFSDEEMGVVADATPMSAIVAGERPAIFAGDADAAYSALGTIE